MSDQQMKEHIDHIEQLGRFSQYAKEQRLQDERQDFELGSREQKVMHLYQDKFRRLGTLRKMDIPAPVPLFGWLNENEITLVHGGAGVGKSQFCMSIAVAVAGGGQFLGWSSDKPQSTVYVDGENGAYAMRAMAEQLAAVVGCDGDTLNDNLVIFADDHSAEPFDLVDPVKQEFFIAMIEHNATKLVILDNVRTLFHLEDENAADSWADVNSFLKRLRQHSAVILVHHDRKTGGYSGSSNAETLVNTRIGLTAVEATHNLVGCGAAFDIEFGKVRALRTGAHKGHTVGLHPVKGWVTRFDGAGEFYRALTAAQSGEFKTQTALATALGMDKSKLNKLLKKHDPDGQVKAGLQAAKDAEAVEDCDLTMIDTLFDGK